MFGVVCERTQFRVPHFIGQYPVIKHGINAACLGDTVRYSGNDTVCGVTRSYRGDIHIEWKRLRRWYRISLSTVGHVNGFIGSGDTNRWWFVVSMSIPPVAELSESFEDGSNLFHLGFIFLNERANKMRAPSSDTFFRCCFIRRYYCAGSMQRWRMSIHCIRIITLTKQKRSYRTSLSRKNLPERSYR